ncbi:MAG: DUF3987 domain-containing protein [Phycisphaerales bacterium]|nr:DUF3987 domain-containing protein [Phycisphaerales bacterium]
MTQPAIDYAARGWAVFACLPRSKEPATPHGFKDASKDPAKVAEQFARMPSANIGIATGAASGVWVLDIDPRNGGDESIRKLAADGRELGETLIAITGGGGLHYFYRVNGAPVRCRSNLWPGVDVKGDGGYIVAPGSIHPSGESYEWMNEKPIVDAPDWLLQAVTVEPAKPEPKPIKVSSGDTSKTLAALLQIKTTDKADGSRRLYTAACRCVEHGLSDADALAAIRAYSLVRPFPRDWTDAQIIQRIRDAEAKVTRGAAMITESPTPRVNTPQHFPVDVLPEPVRSFVKEASKAIGCDTSYAALPLLSALAACIGNTRRIQLKRAWTEPPILWTAIVGESGTLKSPPFRLAMKPIRKRQGEALKRQETAMAEYEIASAQYEKAYAEWKRKKSTYDQPPTKPEPPHAERIIVSDVTVEGLVPILLDNPRGLLLGRDELSGWIGSFDRYVGNKGGADAAHWLSMHNAESIIVDRKTGTPRTIFVPSASVCVCGTIQPRILERVIGDHWCPVNGF